MDRKRAVSLYVQRNADLDFSTLESNYDAVILFWGAGRPTVPRNLGNPQLGRSSSSHLE
jgi:hypothetical protein